MRGAGWRDGAPDVGEGGGKVRLESPAEERGAAV